MPSLFIASSGLLDGDPSAATLVWVLVCAALVLFMQAGFCLLESGLSRSKHSINVAIKNLADLAAGRFEGGSGQKILLGVGLLATVFVTVYITRLARAAIREYVPSEAELNEPRMDADGR